MPFNTASSSGPASSSASPAAAASSSPRPHQVSLHTPVRRARTSSTDSDGSNGVRRTRFNSREFLQPTPDVLEELDDDHDEQMDHLMPLEYGRSKKMMDASFTIFLTTYASLILLVQFFVSTLYLAMGWGGSSSSDSSDDSDNGLGSSLRAFSWPRTFTSWTVTNAIHLLVTIIYIHWLKGSFLLDEQGELNAMTTWEQLEAVPYAKNNVAVRRTLLTVPTVLAYTACVTSHFDPFTCGVNVILWSIAMLAKLPFMNGVRLFGINRTAGIDDLPRKKQS